VSALTKTEIGRAVTAIRELSEIIERLHKATWPEEAGDIIRKSDLLDHLPRASQSVDVSIKALVALESLNRRLDKLEAGRDIDAQTPRKTYSVS
jgi:hypothetical protein